eukprot:GHVU01143949.1.p3 GENE.GHVU01143949.1~~GHVU01143949.1.p3  ORF type:complete len:101 (-),score=10.63 GHVU01143949.1:1180-1482(-)
MVMGRGHPPKSGVRSDFSPIAVEPLANVSLPFPHPSDEFTGAPSIRLSIVIIIERQAFQFSQANRGRSNGAKNWVESTNDETAAMAADRQERVKVTQRTP